MIEQTKSNLLSALSNGHIKWPLVVAAGLEIAAVFLPTYRDRLLEVQKILLAYGIIAAANSSGPTQQPAERKSDEKS